MNIEYEEKKNRIANRREGLPNMVSGSSFFILYGKTYNLSGAGACAGVDTVTAGSPVSGHTTSQILCRGLDAFVVKKPVFASSSTSLASVRFPGPSVGAAPVSLGRQPTVRSLPPISCIYDVPSTLPPDSIWREELDESLPTTDPPDRPYGSHHHQIMGINEKETLPVCAVMPAITAQDIVPSEIIQIGTQINKKANLENDVEGAQVGSVKKESQARGMDSPSKCISACLTCNAKKKGKVNGKKCAIRKIVGQRKVTKSSPLHQ